MEVVKVRYISDVSSMYLKKGEVYEARPVKNDPLKKLWAIHIEEDDDPGWYACSRSLFEVVAEE